MPPVMVKAANAAVPPRAVSPMRTRLVEFSVPPLISMNPSAPLAAASAISSPVVSVSLSVAPGSIYSTAFCPTVLPTRLPVLNVVEPPAIVSAPR